MKFYKYGFWIVLILLIALFVLNVLNIWPHRKTPPKPEAIKTQIEANYQSLSKLYADNDFEGIAKLYKEDAVLAAPGKAYQKGRSEAVNFWKQLKEEGVIEVKFRMLEFYTESEVSFDLTQCDCTKESEEGEVTNSSFLVMSGWGHIVECPRLIEAQNFNILEEEEVEEEVE